MNYQPRVQNTTPPCGFPPVLADLVDAYAQEKSSVFHICCDNKKVIFSRFRPHNVLSYGIAYKDARTGSVHTISGHQSNISPFSALFRTKKGRESAYIVFENGLELSSDGSMDFVAYFCVKIRELESAALYTISKCGDDICCTENYSTKHTPPTHFCYATFTLLGGLNNGIV